MQETHQKIGGVTFNTVTAWPPGLRKCTSTNTLNLEKQTEVNHETRNPLVGDGAIEEIGGEMISPAELLFLQGALLGMVVGIVIGMRIREALEHKEK